jgi:hypothetical protein
LVARDEGARSAARLSLEASPADECASEGEEGFVDVVAYLPADPQAAEPVQVGERAFHDPALGAESGAVLGAPAAMTGFTPRSQTRRRDFSWS